MGHATVLAELGGARLLTDPLLRGHFLGVVRRHGPVPAPSVAEGIDAVLISHLHHDHLDFPSLRQVGRDTRVIVPAGGRRTLARRGFRNVTELSPGETTGAGQTEIRAVPATHEGRRYGLGKRVEAVGYELSAAGRRVYFAGDTDLYGEMGELAGGLDVALLPIAGWGPHTGIGHLDPYRAAKAAAMVQPRIAVPIHWGTFLRLDLGRRMPGLLTEPPLEFAAQLAELAPGVESRVLEPGSSLEFGAPSA